ncbi:oxidoreductase-like protein [Paraphaeosphaeria sporulosa]|uniref:Oxidoreductase-like protein n=1 Tax=Paraphaeosphaeria sporulosa TaxID=1460663 RepID=A0A177CGU8_9PLEO|nr:oxidoreductase-like protein [Paraphaeosphaeria sporulosa]OAG06795.1 oxidoreductase-like protein [Paraphaeosphaeria sporulosa]
MSSKPAIGFCGLGAMGFGMATHLVKQGYPVTGFDVYAPTLERFSAAGGTPSTSLSESAKDKAYYICMVATAQQAEQALFGDDGIVAGLPQGAVLYLTSTVPSSYAQSVEKKLADVGRGDIFFIDAPVSGGAIRAADGTLSIMAGASEAAFEKGKFLLDELTAPAKLFIVAGGVGAGSNMKMVHQVLAAIHIISVSEAFGFAARLGLNGSDVREHVIGGKAWSWMFENRSVRTLKEDYFPGASAVTIILKDTGIITSMANLVDFPVPLCSIAEQLYITGLNKDFGAQDDAGLVRLWTSEPVTSLAPLADEDKKAKLELVSNLLNGIHLCAAAEGISFAKHLGVPLAQYYELCVEAAGGSTQYKEQGTKMIDIIEGKQGHEGASLRSYRDGLKAAITEARDKKIPLHLGNGALTLIEQAGKEQSLSSLLKLYSV